MLFFLWIAFAIVTIIAFFAILFTGRYPRSLFDFNLGVLRWSWRVGYYTYSALGTDRYPPFSLARSRTTPRRWTSPTPSGSPAAWSWSSGGCWPSRSTPSSPCSPAAPPTPRPGRSGQTWQADGLYGGLIGLLVFFAAIALLFAGRYPRGLYNLVVGMNRWVLRVVAYAALMTDAYPPFRLDQGGTGACPPPHPTTSHQHRPHPPRPRPHRSARTPP